MDLSDGKRLLRRGGGAKKGLSVGLAGAVCCLDKRLRGRPYVGEAGNDCCRLKSGLGEVGRSPISKLALAQGGKTLMLFGDGEESKEEADGNPDIRTFFFAFLDSGGVCSSTALGLSLSSGKTSSSSSTVTALARSNGFGLEESVDAPIERLAFAQSGGLAASLISSSSCSVSGAVDSFGSAMMAGWDYARATVSVHNYYF